MVLGYEWHRRMLEYSIISLDTNGEPTGEPRQVWLHG